MIYFTRGYWGKNVNTAVPLLTCLTFKNKSLPFISYLSQEKFLISSSLFSVK